MILLVIVWVMSHIHMSVKVTKVNDGKNDITLNTHVHVKTTPTFNLW